MKKKEAPKDTANQVQIGGTVTKILFKKEGFTIGVMDSADAREIKFTGKLDLKIGDQVKLFGVFGTHPKYGAQFQAEGFEYVLDMNIDGLAEWLAKNPNMKSVGPVRAASIAREFGDNFEKALEEYPERIASIAKVPIKVIYQLREEWQRNKSFNACAIELAKHGLTYHQINSIIRQLGNAAVTIVKEDPYIMIRLLDGFGFKRVDAIARKLGVEKNAIPRLKAGLFECVKTELDDGNCWTERKELVKSAEKLLVMDSLDAKERIDKALTDLICQNIVTSACLGDKELIAVPWIREQEEFILARFSNSRFPHSKFLKNPGIAQRFLSELKDSRSIELNDLQREAFEKMEHNSVCLLVGNAGSGKTFTLSLIAEMCERAGMSIALCAPTGKAAKRIEQLAKREAQTIHRLLGYNGIEFYHNEFCRVPFDVVIIDESSMLDIPLAYQLISAIDLAKTAILIVGDNKQLPPVGPGALLRDLIESGLVATTVLTEIVRQAGKLEINSRAILQGIVTPTDEKSGAVEPWYVVRPRRFDDSEEVAKYIDHLFMNVIDKNLGFNLTSDVQVITPMHDGALGTKALNIRLQRLLQRKLHGFEVPKTPEGRSPMIHLHDKVIQTQNDYITGIMNGAVGIVEEINEDEKFALIRFDDKSIEFKLGSTEMHRLHLAYALTCHKFQGSEVPLVIVIAHKSMSFMGSRNWFYTAVTRASKAAIILGDSWGISEFARKVQDNNRRTFLSVLAVGSGR